jgi:hypothetical protein
MTTHVVEVKKNTIKSCGGVGLLVSVSALVNGKRRKIFADEWKELLSRPDVEHTLSAREGVWPAAQ